MHAFSVGAIQEHMVSFNDNDKTNCLSSVIIRRSG